MSDKKCITVLGGDLRSVFVSKSLQSDGYKVYNYGLGENDNNSNLFECIEKSDIVVMGIPASRDNFSLNAPMSDKQIIIDTTLKKMLEGKKIFCGLANKLYNACADFKQLDIFDYGNNEEFSVKNAVLTAEGAISLAINEHNKALQGSRCLICGYGRIGKILAFKLKLLGVNVTVSARKNLARVWAEAYGFKAINIDEIKSSLPFDIIFNTVPSLIIDKTILSEIPTDTLIIDLASSPGGVDFKTAEDKKIKAIQALGLPSKFSPEEAGEIIKTIICKELKGV